MHIYLIRHGETDWNTKLLFQGHSNTSLNATGLSQARCMGRELKDVKIEAMISSDLNRAKQTAEEIRKLSNFSFKISVDRGLRERDYGNLEGKEYNLYHSRKKGFTGEKDPVFFARVNRAFKAIVKKYRGRDIAIVTHGGVVRQIVANILGLKEYKRLRVYNASISEVFYIPQKDAFFLLCFNSVAHLPKAQRNKIQYHIKGV